MAKGFTFGKIKQPEKEEQKSDDSGVDVTDIVNTYIDENLETIAQLRHEKEELTKKLNQLEYELLTKNTSIQGYKETIENLNVRIVELGEANLELEETQAQEKITAKVPHPIGFKPAIDNETIAQIRVYAYSILYKKGTIKFYEAVAKKFGVSTGSAYKYCKEIYQQSDSND